MHPGANHISAGAIQDLLRTVNKDHFGKAMVERGLMRYAGHYMEGKEKVNIYRMVDDVDMFSEEDAREKIAADPYVRACYVLIAPQFFINIGKARSYFEASLMTMEELEYITGQTKKELNDELINIFLPYTNIIN